MTKQLSYDQGYIDGVRAAMQAVVNLPMTESGVED